MTSPFQHSAPSIAAPSVRPSTVIAERSRWSPQAGEQRPQSAGEIEVLHQIGAGGEQIGQHGNACGRFCHVLERRARPRRVRTSRSGGSRRWSSRRAPCRSARPFMKAARVRMSDGFRSSQTISTIREPASETSRGWPESTAGTEEAPVIVMPMASTIDVMVEAVPIVLQVPVERVMRLSRSIQSSCGDPAEPQILPVLLRVRAGPGLHAVPLAVRHRPRRAEDGRQTHADRPHQERPAWTCRSRRAARRRRSGASAGVSSVSMARKLR